MAGSSQLHRFMGPYWQCYNRPVALLQRNIQGKGTAETVGSGSDPAYFMSCPDSLMGDKLRLRFSLRDEGSCETDTDCHQSRHTVLAVQDIAIIHAEQYQVIGIGFGSDDNLVLYPS